MEQVGVETEMPSVESLHDHAQSHLGHSQDHGDLHLQGIHELQLVLGSQPGGIHPHRVHAVIVLEHLVNQHCLVRCVVGPVLRSVLVSGIGLCGDSVVDFVRA